MTATTASGHASVIKLDPAAGAAFVPIIYQKDATLTYARDILEDTNKGSGQWKGYQYGNFGASISISGVQISDPGLMLDGATEYGHTLDHADLDLTTAITIEAVFTCDNITGAHMIAHKFDATDGYILQSQGDELELLVDNSGTTDSTNTTTNSNLVIGTQYKVKVIYDGGGNTVKFYLDDSLRAVNTVGVIPDACGVNVTRLTIGTDATAGGTFWNGTLKKVAIAALAVDDTTRVTQAESVAYYKFDGDMNDTGTAGAGAGTHDLTPVAITAADYGDLTLTTIRNNILAGTKFNVEFYESGTAITTSFSAIIQDYGLTYPQNDIAGYTVTLLADGIVS